MVLFILVCLFVSFCFFYRFVFIKCLKFFRKRFKFLISVINGLSLMLILYFYFLGYTFKGFNELEDGKYFMCEERIVFLWKVCRF